MTATLLFNFYRHKTTWLVSKLNIEKYSNYEAETLLSTPNDQIRLLIFKSTRKNAQSDLGNT